MKPAMNPARPITPISGRRIHAARWLALALSVGALALATACSGDADHRSSDADRGSGGVTSAPDVPAPSATTAGGTPAEDATGSPAGPPVLADGRHPTYLTGLDVARRTVTFDLIQFLTGAEAARIWAQTHPDEPEGPPNDYLIVNDNPRLRVLPVADQVHVTVVDAAGGSGGIANLQITLDELPRHLAGQQPDTVDNRLSYAPYWLTVSNGLVTRIEEQFIP